jgi:nucleotide-binding universal stress UspA family protein
MNGDAVERRSVMFRRILVPLDGSTRAELALPVAAHLARVAGGVMVLARVVSTPTSSGSGAPQAAVEAILTHERDTAARYLAAVSHRADLLDMGTRVEIREATAIAPALLDTMRASHADLAIMCSHGHTGFTRWTLGSVAQKVARHATIPMVVLHADGPLLQSAEDDPRPVCALVPLDGSPEAETTLEPAAQLVAALATPAQGALHLLHVVQLEEAPPHTTSAEHDAQETLRREAERYLRAVAERLKQASQGSAPLDVSWSVVFDPDVAAAILDEGAVAVRRPEQPAYDLIAMSSHGRSGVLLWALGSVTDRVLQTSKLPLLIVRAPGPTASPPLHGEEERETEAEISAWPGY